MPYSPFPAAGIVDGATATPSWVPWGHDWVAGGGTTVCVGTVRRMWWWSGLQVMGSSCRVGSACRWVGLDWDGVGVGGWLVVSRLARHGASWSVGRILYREMAS